MIDASLLANSPQGNLQIFIPNTGSVGITGWQIWNKPRGYTMCQMIAIGAAGGGGGGVASGSTGGGGGGSGAIARLIIPLWFLPDILYVQVRAGGRGGASGAAGSDGSRTIIGNAPNNNVPASNYLVSNDSSSATGGAASSTAGSDENIATIAGVILGTLGLWSAVVGNNGSTGGSTAAGTDLTALSLTPLSGGAGGGGGANVGGSILAAGLIPKITGGANTGTAGESGITLIGPQTGFMACGGAGGGGGAGATAGRGGNGGTGCGGGGGGGCASGAGGGGGNGGDGLAIIQCW